MRIQTTAIGLAALFAVLAPASVGTASRLHMRVYPTVASAPAKVWVHMRIERDVQHRAVEIIAESEDFYRSSEIELDGDRAPRTNVFEFRGVPAGVYDVRAVLKGEGGYNIETVSTKVRLYGDGHEW
jgi:hypothetical protein